MSPSRHKIIQVFDLHIGEATEVLNVTLHIDSKSFCTNFGTGKRVLIILLFIYVFYVLTGVLIVTLPRQKHTHD